MDFDSSSKFIASLAKFLQSLCNGYVDFDKGVEVIGHIYINVDSDTGKKVDYVLNEKVCKNDNSITFISNSFHAQPAEKPKPIPKKAELEKPNEDTIVMEDSVPTVPSSTNVGTLGSFRNTPRAGSQDISFTPGSKRPRTPPQRRNQIKSGSSPASKHMSPSTRYQDSGGPSTKMSRTDIPPSPLNSSGVGGEDYENQNVFQSGGEEEDSENFSSNFLDEHNTSEIDQKPIIDPDISIVKEEYMSNQQNSCAYAGTNQSSGPGRGKNQQSAYPVMMHPNSSGYSGPTAISHQTESYASSALDGAGDPSIFADQSGEFHLNWLPFKGGIKKKDITCNSSSRGSSKLSRVVHKDGSVRYVCDHCEKQYRHYRDLIRHRYQCLQKKILVCGECSKTFFRSDALTYHLRHCHSNSFA